MTKKLFYSLFLMVFLTGFISSCGNKEEKDAACCENHEGHHGDGHMKHHGDGHYMEGDSCNHDCCEGGVHKQCDMDDCKDGHHGSCDHDGKYKADCCKDGEEKADEGSAESEDSESDAAPEVSEE